jgi:hypothetical protein
VQRPKQDLSSTVAFIVRVNSLGGVDKTHGVPCGLLACFGMDGYSTLIWNHIVRQNPARWITKPGFVMVELIFKRPVPRRPLTPEFASDPTNIEVRQLTKSA